VDGDVQRQHCKSASSPDTTTPAQNINSGPSSPTKTSSDGVIVHTPAGGANIAGVTFTSSSGGALVDADTTFSIGWVTSAVSLKRVAVHELVTRLALRIRTCRDKSCRARPAATIRRVPATSYNGLSDLQPDDIQGCLCLYGPSAGNVGKGYICGLPTYRDFGSVPIGNDSAKQSVVVKNASTSGNLTINAISFSGSGFRRLAGCEPERRSRRGRVARSTLCSRPAMLPVCMRRSCESMTSDFDRMRFR
jgi:hypothetical protein